MNHKVNVLIIVVVLVFALACSMCLPDKGKSQEKQKQSINGKIEQPVSAEELFKASQSFVQLARNAAPAVVNITVSKTVSTGFHSQQNPFWDDWMFKFFGPQQRIPKEFKQRGQGSGFIIDKEGHIVTNNHVVANADEITITFKDELKVRAEVVGNDAKTDLALLKINPKDLKKLPSVPTLPFGNSEALQVGEWVIAIGNPFGLEHTVTAGIVSAKGRVIGAGPYDDFIQTDASINPGNSGGPLINTKGEVVGINAMINASGQGIGFAIPSNMAKSIIDQLSSSGAVTRGWLGVGIQSVTPELADALELKEPQGALVRQVFEGSPAERAGFEVKDVIVSFDGKKINKDTELPTIVASTPVGKKVKVEIIRNKKRKTLKLKVGEMADQNVTAGKKTDENYGLTVENITSDIARKLGVRASKGVLVSRIDPGSPALEAGLKRGDVILEVNNAAVSTVKEFYKQLNKDNEKKSAMLMIQRDEDSFFITMRTP